MLPLTLSVKKLRLLPFLFTTMLPEISSCVKYLLSNKNYSLAAWCSAANNGSGLIKSAERFRIYSSPMLAMNFGNSKLTTLDFLAFRATLKSPSYCFSPFLNNCHLKV